MLTKNFERTYTPGTPGRPEVPARPEYTVCQQPPQGEWVFRTTFVYFLPNEVSRISIPGSVTGPYGPITLAVDYYNPYTRRWYTQNTVVMYLAVGRTEWAPFPNPGAPVCTTYPAQPYVPAVPPVAPRWDTAPTVGWDAGANSVVSVGGDCIATWTMGKVVGVYVGLTSDLGDVTRADRLSHAVYFHQRSGAPYFRVVEGGVARSNDLAYALGDEFSIRRARGVVSYWRNGVRLQDSMEESFGEVNVGSALYMSGDLIP